MDFLKGLNPVQKKTVLHPEGPVLILAGAGSGKTLVLTRRIAYLIKEKGEKPAHILALTFTNKAAGEIRERVEGILSGEVKGIWTGTFHSIGLKILRAEHETAGLPRNFVVYDEKEQLSLVKRCGDKAGAFDDEVFTPLRAYSYIDRFKNDGLLPQDFKDSLSYFEERLISLYRLYQETLERNGAVDFGDLIIKPIRLFERNPHILDGYRKRFKHILVDEFQDTNKAQYRLIRLLLNSNENLWVVGDDDQSIYGWRGAEIRNILDLERDFPSLSIIRLEQNYRSTSNILNAANSLIKNNRLRKGKTLWTENEEGERISYVLLDNEQEEALWVGRRILGMVKEGKGVLGDFAIFYRTNSQSRAVEEGLIRLGLPYEIVGGVRFYERMEIKDILAYIKGILNPLDSQSILRIINTPPRGIGKATIERLEELAYREGLSLYEAIFEGLKIHAFNERTEVALRGFTGLMEGLKGLIDLSPHDFIKRLLKDTGYLDMWDRGGDEGRIENVMEVLSAVKSFEDDNPDATLSDFLAHVALVRDIDLYGGRVDRVTLMTLHSAKGLEFPYVFMTGMEEGLFPHPKSVEEGAIEEERRLCYVGMTRAKKGLFLTGARERRVFGSVKLKSASRFIDEIDSEVQFERETSLIDKVEGHVAHTPILSPSPDSQSLSFDSQFRTGEKVEHPDFGIGKVVGMQGENILVVAFQKNGIKKLMLSHAPLKRLEKGL